LRSRRLPRLAFVASRQHLVRDAEPYVRSNTLNRFREKSVAAHENANGQDNGRETRPELRQATGPSGVVAFFNHAQVVLSDA
jgi:hypothetical protein